MCVVSASHDGQVTCEVTICEEHTNRSGSLHGGLTATLIDSVSTLALLSSDQPPGVSTDLNIRYG